MGTWHKSQYKFLITPRSIILLKIKVTDKSCRENKNTCFVYNNIFWKSCHLWNNVYKYCRFGQATGDDMAPGHCMLDNYGYRYTLRIYNTYCFSTATEVAQMYHIVVTLYIHCLSCLADVTDCYWLQTSTWL
jgi:hypothetical protein